VASHVHEKAKEFAASVALKEAMTKAGVLDTPTIYFLESIDRATSFVHGLIYAGGAGVFSVGFRCAAFRVGGCFRG
jgi:hypothetical protein